jgi:hypothetical protein
MKRVGVDIICKEEYERLVEDAKKECKKTKMWTDEQVGLPEGHRLKTARDILKKWENWQ